MAGKPAASTQDSERRLVALLRKQVVYPGHDDPKTTLAEALSDLSKAHGLLFEFNKRAFVFEDFHDVTKTEITVPNELPPMKAPLARVIATVLARVEQTAQDAATLKARRQSNKLLLRALKAWKRGETVPAAKLALEALRFVAVALA